MAGAAKSFERIRLKIRELKEDAIPTILDELAATAEQVIADEFLTGTDPDARTWSEPKRGGVPLIVTGKLANSFDVRVEGDRVVVSTDVFYARMNQGARNMLPKRRRIGKKWATEFRKAIGRAKRKLAKAAKQAQRAQRAKRKKR